jgi:NitT/TauT family transport system ATP-binding protein
MLVNDEVRRSTPVERAGAAAPPTIELAGAGKSFNAHGRLVEALQPIDLTVRKHEFVALVGPSGCGKSTALNLVAGLTEPTIGQVRYNGDTLSGLNTSVGYMTQKDTLFAWRNAQDNVRIALELRCRRMPRDEADHLVAEMIKLVGLSGFERHYPAELSGGMRKRLALARSLVYRPDTLLMDEPFGALDAQLKLIMHDQLQRLHALRPMTVMFVTHDLGEAIALADRIVVFSGRPGYIRLVSEVNVERPRDVFGIRFTKAFQELYEELWDVLKDEIAKGTEN